MSPVAAGGYFWVFFDSVRHYGKLGLQRQLWGAAIDISRRRHLHARPSHPAFYLPGQEFGTGNHRAFAALDPCKKDGDKCTSGIDCCGGFCYIDGPAELVDPVGSCSPKMTDVREARRALHDRRRLLPARARRAAQHLHRRLLHAGARAGLIGDRMKTAA